MPFATRPGLAEAMVGRAMQAGVPFRRATGAYGGNPGLREWLEEREIPHVLAVACNAAIAAGAGAMSSPRWSRQGRGSG